MQYSLLLAGKNSELKKKFFTQMYGDFECLSTSNDYEDIMNHLKYFTPSALVCCLLDETPDDVRQISAVQDKLESSDIKLVVVGSRENCDFFRQNSSYEEGMVLTLPMSNQEITERIFKFLRGEISYEELQQEESVEQEEAEEAKQEEIEKKTHTSHNMGKRRNDDEMLWEVEAMLQMMEKPQSKSRKHVLVVDDDPLVLKMIKEQLHENYDVGTAINGNVALKFLENKKTDLILLDYEMPGMSGPDILKKLKAKDETKFIPVVFLTGVSEREKIQKVLALKPRGYLLKPVDRKKLMEIIEDVLGSKKA